MWVRLDCTLASHRKLLRAGGDAAWFWVCGLAHANGHTTNGVIHRDDLVALYPTTEWTTAKRLKLVAKLVEIGLWDVIDADSWMIHDYADHQSEAMSEAVEARREREREKKRSQRSAGKSGGSQGLSPGDTHGDTQGSPPPVSPSASPGVSPPSDRPTVRPSSGETTSLLSPAPPAPPTPPLALEPPAEKPARAKRAAKPKADADPPPFSVADALGAIASTAGGRFVPGVAATWTGGWVTGLRKLIRRFPDLALWRRVGAHVAAGGGWAKPTLGPEWAASDGFVAVVNGLPDWERRGMPVVDARFAVKPQVVAPPSTREWKRTETDFGDLYAEAFEADQQASGGTR